MKLKINNFVLGAVIGAVIVGGYTTARAYMTGQKTLGESTVRSTNLDLTVTPETKLFDFSGLAPGGTTGEKTVTIKNTGGIGIKYRISAQASSEENDNDLYKVLKVKISEYDKDNTWIVTHYTSSKYLSTLNEFTLDEKIPPGEERNLGIEVYLATTPGNEIAGKETQFDLIFDAAQEDGSF
ncbi:hypothetical protein L6255_02030 [Candidatus Parcubacteria bacterium]|nr:hypothetical protein [Patescibacteria group bacterium]MCG2689194.1 hypothetical protein [Candidatus Parcubacteria bacterium]